MRVPIAAILAVAGGLMAANMLGVASGETSPTPPVRAVSVEGVANVPIDQHASSAAAIAAYRQGMGDAVVDGLGKAQFLAGKTGASVGSVQSVTEGSGYIRCTSSSSNEGAEYEGAEPDFGSGAFSYSGVSVGAPRAAPSLPSTGGGVSKGRRRSRSHRHSARSASTGSCLLYTQVALTYQLG